MEDDEFEALALDYLVAALSFALSALELADAPGKGTLPLLQTVADEREGLEAKAVAVLSARGYTWEEMAHQLGVTRQSAHKRLARRSVALRSTATPDRARALRFERQRRLRSLAVKVEELQRAQQTRLLDHVDEADPPSTS